MKKLKSILIICMTVWLTGCSHEAASVGIIGGADGPTAIFVTSKVNEDYLSAIICLGIILAVIAVILIKRKNK